MRGMCFLKGLKFAALAAVAVLVFGGVTMALWNRLLPDLFGLHPVSFWQAVGLLILARLLFGGFKGRHGGHHWHWRQQMLERWEKMTPEEREKFRAGLKGCGWMAPPEPENKA